MKILTGLFSVGCMALLSVAGQALSDDTSRQIFTITLTAEDNGTRLVETRNMTAAEIAMLIAGGTVDYQTTQQGTPPPQPRPPLAGTYPSTMTRVDYHQETYGWVRDTSYGRAPGSDVWRLIGDNIQATGAPPKCDPRTGDCTILPN